MNKKIFLSVLIIAFGTICTHAIKVKIISDPEPTCTEPPGVELKLDCKLNMNIDDENFVGKPGSFTVDKTGNIYIFDNLQAAIFKFDKDNKFLKKFDKDATNPKKWESPKTFNGIRLNIQNNHLLTFDTAQRKLSIYNLNGSLLNEYWIEYDRPFAPVSDKKGNFYTPSIHDGTIDMLNGELKYNKTLLDQAVLQEFLFFEPNYMYKRRNIFPGPHIHFFFVAKGMLLVYSENNSGVYLLKDGWLHKHFYLWPEKVLKLFKNEFKETLDNCYKGVQCHKKLAINVFPDQDDDRFFYIQFSSKVNDHMMALHKFDLSGNLINLFLIENKEDGYPRFSKKIHNRFYVMEKDNIYIYKEKKQ